MKTKIDPQQTMANTAISPEHLNDKEELDQESDGSYDRDQYDDDSSLFTSDESWDSSESFLEMEERVQEFACVGSTPALAALVFDTADFRTFSKMKKGDSSQDGSVTSGKHSIASAVVLSDAQSIKSFLIRRTKSDQFLQKVSNTAAESSEDGVGEDDCTKPEDLLQKILQETDIQVKEPSKEIVKELMVQIPMNNETYTSYAAIANSVRTGDLSAVIEHVEGGNTLQCCNKFQETAIHLVCRRGQEKILKYMLDSDVSPCIQDDNGRTPLHELAWASTPNFEMVKAILLSSPDLLYVKDKRGSTPLSFVGRTNWEPWNEFLQAHRDILPPKVLVEAFTS